MAQRLLIPQRQLQLPPPSQVVAQRRLSVLLAAERLCQLPVSCLQVLRPQLAALPSGSAQLRFSRQSLLLVLQPPEVWVPGLVLRALRSQQPLREQHLSEAR